MNISYIKEEFPYYFQQENIYMDSAGTNLKPESVINSLTNSYKEYYSNVGRSNYKLALKVEDEIESTRKLLRDFLKVPNDYELVFTSGTTDSINLFVEGYLNQRHEKIKSISVSVLEHHSSLLPHKMLAKKYNKDFNIVEFDSVGEINLDYINLINEGENILSLTHASNVTGTILDLREIYNTLAVFDESKLIRIVDGAQSVGHISVDISEIRPDAFVCSAHKMFGPFGAGLLITKNKIIEEMMPIRFGGGMVQNVHTNKWQNGPEKFYAGTQNIPSIIAWGQAVKFIKNVGIENIRIYIEHIIKYLLNELRKIPNIHIVGSEIKGDNCGIVSFTMSGIHSHDIAGWLDHHNIQVRSGHMCAQMLMKYYRINSCVRISLNIYNTIDEIDYLIKHLNLLV